MQFFDSQAYTVENNIQSDHTSLVCACSATRRTSRCIHEYGMIFMDLNLPVAQPSLDYTSTPSCPKARASQTPPASKLCSCPRTFLDPSKRSRNFHQILVKAPKIRSCLSPQALAAFARIHQPMKLEVTKVRHFRSRTRFSTRSLQLLAL